MNRMLLVRHAHAFDHEASDPGLDPVGRRQAAAIAERLAGEGVRRVLSSPKRRAAETADVIARRVGLVVETSALLDDRTPFPSSTRWGDYPARRWEWLRRTPIDERDEDARALRAAWSQLSASVDAEAGALVLVTHAFVVASFVSQVLAAPPAAWMQLPAANASLTELELRSGGEFAVVAFNDVGHLRDATS